jgi:hypothetical protein
MFDNCLIQHRLLSMTEAPHRADITTVAVLDQGDEMANLLAPEEGVVVSSNDGGGLGVLGESGIASLQAQQAATTVIRCRL